MQFESFQIFWLVITNFLVFTLASPARHSDGVSSQHGATLEEIDKSKDQIIARLKTQIEKNEYTLSVLEKSLQTILRALEPEVGTTIPETKPEGSKEKIRDVLETKLERKEDKLSTLEGSLRMIIWGLDSTYVRNTEVPLDIVDVIRRKDKIIDSLKTKIENQERKISAAETMLRSILASLFHAMTETATNNIDQIIENLEMKNERKDEKISGTIASINGIIEVIRSDDTKQIESKKFTFKN
jgi:hypothetical protein